MQTIKPSMSTLLFVGLAVGDLLSVSVGDTLNVTDKKADPRLDKLVTFSSQKVAVGELLEELSKQTGVKLTNGARDGSADPRLTIALNKIPLFSAMDGLWSELSYRKGEWSWVRSGKSPDFEYTLIRPLAAQRWPAMVGQQIQQDFEQLAEGLFSAAELQGADRRKIIDTVTKDILKSPGKLGDIYMRGDRMFRGLRTMSRVLDSATKAKVLRGQELPTFATSDLPEESKQFVHSVWAEFKGWRRASDGTNQPTPEPEHVRFRTDRIPGDIVPVLVIEMDGIGGYGYAGGAPLSDLWEKRFQDLWMLDGDSTKASANVNSLKSETKKDVPGGYHPQEQRLIDLANTKGLSLIARASDEAADFGAFDQLPIETTLTNLRKLRPRLDSKWRGSILLLAAPTWIFEDQQIAPWRLIKECRAERGAGGKCFAPKDLFNAADKLSQDELLLLYNDYPVFRFVAQFQALFARLSRSPDTYLGLRTERGVPLETVLPYVAASPLWPREKIDNAPGQKRFRLTVRPTAMGLDYRIEVLAENGDPLALWGQTDIADGISRPTRVHTSKDSN